MRFVFMGTPDFAVPCLERLIAAGHEPAGVFTQPDKPVGRKQVLTPPAVKTCAIAHGIPVYQPSTLRDGTALAVIRELVPDIIIVAAYGKLVPKDILDYPRYGCVNVHGSLLPAYRGAAPIQWSVINGDAETGVTIMQMNEGLDTGDILSALGADMLIEALEMLEEGSLTPVPQDDGAATYAPMLDKQISVIDWNKPALQVHNLIRGLYSWPIAQTVLDGKKLKIYRAHFCPDSGRAGTVISVDPLTVACSDGSVVIDELQLEGKKRMDAKAFLIGHPMSIGDTLGG